MPGGEPPPPVAPPAPSPGPASPATQQPHLAALFSEAARLVQPAGADRAELRPNPLTAVLESEGVVLLDGGMSRPLEAELGRKLDPLLWTAEALVDGTGALSEVHRQFCASGSDVATTASYQWSYDAFARKGATPQQAEQYLRNSISAARSAGPKVVAASIGPLAATYADGSEYNPPYATPGAGGSATYADLLAYHGTKARLLAAEGPDCLAFETVGCAAEAAVVVSLLQAEVLPPSWLCFACSDGGTLVSGEPLLETLSLVLRHDAKRGLVGVGVNCLHPDATAQALINTTRAVSAAQRPDIVILCYPNTGQVWCSQEGEWVRGTGASDEDFAKLCAEWYNMGARALGGCCQTTPATIAAMRDALATSRKL